MQHAVGKTKADSKLSSGPRGRPTADRIPLIEGNIREGAMRIFLAEGFEAASMDAIARAASVSKGTLYSRYQSKELLFRAVLEEELERWSDRTSAQDHLLPETIEARLEHHARTLIEVFQWPQYRQINRLIESASVTFPDIARVWQEIGVVRYINFLKADIAKAKDVPQSDAESLELYSNLFLHGLAGWFKERQVEHADSPGNLDDFVRKLAGSIGYLITNYR